MVEACKLAGSLIVLASSVLAGVLYGIREKERYHFLEELKAALILLKGEMAYAKPQMPELLIYLSENSKGAFQIFFSELAKSLESEQGQSFSGLWRKQCMAVFREKDIGKDNMNFLAAIGDSLLVHDSLSMVQIAELYLERTGQRMEREAEGMEEKLRLVRLLSFSFGIVVVLVLV